MHAYQNAQIIIVSMSATLWVPEISPRANLAHPNFFTFYTAIGVKGRLFSPFSLKCASTNTGAVSGTHWAIISRRPIWSVGVPLSGSLGWGHFSSPISDNFDTINK